ncbi:signal transduction histidine kinase [Variovorax sp. 54]|uniref:sensor histidine kinase n=1 Tax=Variovorax sp. 54 TaxID=2035212 RepID=UPI000C191491|nr:HAMP domain-containing sensor histidine kinase [Variovorax sp. 54]PIF74005.1 signal transduction histidine kinase [Variovorax sp. 54]
MNLSLGTAAFFTALLEAVLAAGMWALWARGRARYLIHWGFGFFVFGVGALLLTLRGRIPDFFSILVGNLCTTLSSVLLYAGICVFFDRRRAWLPWMVGILILETALLAYYSYVTYDTSARVYAYGAAQVLIALMTLQTLFTVNRGRGERFKPEVAAVALVALAALVAHSTRLVGTPFFPVPQDFLAAGDFQVLFAFGLQLIHVGYAIAFGNMHASALHEELRKALADAEAKGRQKVEILGYVSHDLRAPLATISGYSSLLLANANQGQRKHLLAIQRGVKYQLNLIDELLGYAKAELQPLAIQPVTADLPLLLDNISEYGVALCSQQNNGFRYQPSTQIPQRINIDGKRLQQVLLNLLSNAAKFTRDGLVTLSVTARKEGATCALNFAVSDTGIGVDLNQNADIFSAFQQVQAASGSSGLGLFIVRRIVEAMGGSLSVTSVYGEGATFSFVLSVPADEADADWVVVEQREIEPVGSSSMPAMPRNLMPEDRALDELAGLALQGRFTDIEHWVAHHADQVAHAAFIARLLDLLERLDFRGIHGLALSGRSDPNT